MSEILSEVYFEESKFINLGELSYSLGKAWLLKHGFKFLYNGFNGFEAWRGWIHIKNEVYSVLVRWKYSNSNKLWRIEVFQSKYNRTPLINGRDVPPQENDTLELAVSGLVESISQALKEGNITTRKVYSDELDFPRRMLALHMYDDEPVHSDSSVPELTRKEA